MKMNSLRATQSILLINWVVAPALGIWIWVKIGFFTADWVWDWLTGLLIVGVGRIGASEHEAFQIETSGEVPGRMASMMILDLLGTFMLPWVVAGFFLGWFGPANSPSSASIKEWWITEYPALVQAVENADNRTLSTSYRTGPTGEAKARLTLTRQLRGGLTLKLNLPAQAMFSVDPKTGEKIPSSTLPVITIRDRNEDGVPDDFNIEPRGEPSYKETVTEDGFIKFRRGPEHQSISLQWSIALGFSVNHFLHGFDSALPRQ
jgi:hypothetical protein